MKESIEVVCDDCRGTGLYCGFMEPRGTAVECVRCAGTGCMTISYEPFKKRSKRKGVRTVFLRGSVVFAAAARDKDGGRPAVDFKTWWEQTSK